ncbi:Ataxin-3 [Paragonimus westermani]|uniref:Ataxin-3 homolog n=1 Tax=Paragonimus westermani TaxID=34504 RepID=A0A5J4NB15_9TREM|nr:Ataxin-3 [Paragonimus westermani]
MDAIFHEKQEGSLCAQHCLNALLQGPYFTAVDLAELASQLDEAERSELSHANNSQESQNMNEEGYFSVQVISRALAIWSLELVPFLRQSPEAMAGREHPENQNAFICNFRQHWFTIRKFGCQWFDLNSLMSKPRLISTTYLTIYLAQLQQEGHSIFIVVGTLPNCEAEQVISLCPMSEHSELTEDASLGIIEPSGEEELDPATQIALAVSKSELDDESASLQRVLQSSIEEAQKSDLERALELSTTDFHSSLEKSELEEAIRLSLTTDISPTIPSSSVVSTLPSAEEIRQKRQAFLNRIDRNADKSF